MVLGRTADNRCEEVCHARGEEADDLRHVISSQVLDRLQRQQAGRPPLAGRRSPLATRHLSLPIRGCTFPDRYSIIRATAR